MKELSGWEKVDDSEKHDPTEEVLDKDGRLSRVPTPFAADSDTDSKRPGTPFAFESGSQEVEAEQKQKQEDLAKSAGEAEDEDAAAGEGAPAAPRSLWHSERSEDRDEAATPPHDSPALSATPPLERCMEPPVLSSSSKEERARLAGRRVNIEESRLQTLVLQGLDSRPRPRVSALQPPSFDLPQFNRTHGEYPSLHTLHRAQERSVFKADLERSEFKRLHVRVAKPTRVDVIADDCNFVRSLCKVAGATERSATGGLQTAHSVRAALAHPGTYGLKHMPKKSAPWRGFMKVHLWGWELDDFLQRDDAMCAVPEIPEMHFSIHHKESIESMDDLQADLDVDLSELDMYRGE